MNEKTTLEIIAPTVEEAIAQGLAQLGLTADAVSVEVLDAGTKGLFGLGRTQVRVRLTVVPPGGMMAYEPEPAAKSEPEAKPVERPKAEAKAKAKPKATPKVEEPAPVKVSDADVEVEHDALLDHTE